MLSKPADTFHSSLWDKIILMKLISQGQTLQTFNVYWPLFVPNRTFALSNSLVIMQIIYKNGYCIIRRFLNSRDFFLQCCHHWFVSYAEKNNVFSQDWFILLSSTNCLYTQRSAGKQMAKSWLLAMKMGMCLFLKKKKNTLCNCTYI